FLAFFAFFAFLALAFFDFFAIVIILLLPPINEYRTSRIAVVFCRHQFNAGRRPPVAQSRSSIVCTTGTDVPLAICTMQPILPAATTSG
ncbi:hypothetical protein, partial [Klebsiella oxytoca]|uniref:hypothetical protein n=1 Tax=Klebsiella oxytoca TaxID=571 RepID=UPI001953450C